jgi:transcriptional regulator with XRE-family HTH domain
VGGLGCGILSTGVIDIGLSKAIGQALRRARLARGWTLRDVDHRSGGRFKPTSVAGYERAHRAISVERFCALAGVYATPPDRLLASALELVDPAARRGIVVDLERLALIDDDDRRRISSFVRDVRERRGDTGEEVISLRAGDVDALALSAGCTSRAMLDALGPALRRP